MLLIIEEEYEAYKKNNENEQVVKDDEQVVKDTEQVVKDDEQVVKDDEQIVKDDEQVVKDDEQIVKGTKQIINISQNKKFHLFYQNILVLENTKHMLVNII